MFVYFQVQHDFVISRSALFELTSTSGSTVLDIANIFLIMQVATPRFQEVEFIRSSYDETKKFKI